MRGAPHVPVTQSFKTYATGNRFLEMANLGMDFQEESEDG